MKLPYKPTLALLGCVACAAGVMPAQAKGFKLLYSFQGGNDGASPQADMVADGHVLYGTTTGGGSGGQGTVFSFDLKKGTEKVLYAFTGSADGNYPAAGLLKIGDTLYGTTESGGSAGWGTVYSVNVKTGAEKVLYSFQGGAGDGANPQSRLIELNGLLYGTAYLGGSSNCGSFGCGTLFAVNPTTGVETTVHFFQNNDGGNPTAGVIAVGKELFGTTSEGGDGNAGTAFSFNPASGIETTIASFDLQGQGTTPISGLTAAHGTLYGMTIQGGAANLGAVYGIERHTGTQTTIYSFNGQSDGALPEAGVIDVGGMLYGTTSTGGSEACDYSGCGTAFAVNPTTGTENILHVFNGNDGSYLWGGLTRVGGTLYGTASGGGGAGSGVIFSITP